MKLLNENCKFQCMSGNPSILITASEQGNSVMKDSRKKVLTDKAKCQVKTPLPCSFLTALANGVPTNCQLSQLPQMQWMGADNKVKCNGNKVLTSCSSVKCIYGGVITPIGSGCVTSIGLATGVYNIDEKVELGGETDRRSESTKNTEMPDHAPDTADSTNEKGLGAAPHEEEKSYASHTLCDYENCSEREACDYFRSQIFVENNSAQLRANFQKNRSADWDNYYSLHIKKNMESQSGGWRIAAHHMISGNQVLMMRDTSGALLYGEIVKLANYFGYDINNEWNCIMLPTNERGFGELEQITKHAIPYDVMWNMGRQWHVGGHAYQLDKDTLDNLSNYYRKNPEQYPTPGNPDFFVNYKEAMKEEMNLLLVKYSKCLCWKKNYEARRKRFFSDMNAISAKVERYLLEFGNNPRKSFPFFVSKIAVEYAYDLPSTSKMVVVYQNADKVRAKRIRVERYMKNGLKIVPVEKEDIEVAGDQQFILFCENVMHFYISSELSGYRLPFQGNSLDEAAIRIVDFQQKDVMKYLFDNSSEIIAFMSQYEYPYQPIARIVNQRGGEK